jgi:uroporphyrinogen III methyltransferase/synthase
VVPVYKTVTDEDGVAVLRERLAAGTLDAITFTASSTVRNCVALIPPAALQQVAVACIGPVTAETAREVGLRVSVVAEEYTSAGLLASLQHFYAQQKQ